MTKDAKKGEDCEKDSIVYLARTNKQVRARLSTDPEALVFTVHSFKGKEAEKIFIEDDLNYSMKIAIATGNKEEMRLYYVAITRAKSELLNAQYCR